MEGLFRLKGHPRKTDGKEEFYMRGRKLLALALCAALTLGLAAPALAVAADDQALMAVTARVKETLGLDTQEFDDFQGWADEDALLGKRWNLEWSGDGVGLSITADDKGKVYSYNRFDTVSDPVIAESWYMGGKLNIPRLPEDKSAAAFEAAKAFLARALESGLESVELENGYAPSLRQDSYRYSGTVLLHGQTSPIKCSITVRASDLAVIRFWRNDQSAGYLGGVPDVDLSTTEDQARALLRSTIQLEAKYVLEPDGKTAMVRYVPVSGDDYYVDAKSGQLVNLSELYKNLWEGGGSANKYLFTTAEAAADMAATANGSLTQAEKDGAAILTGALSKEELDGVLKSAWPEMGLGSYTLSAASYSVSQQELPEGRERTPEDYTVSCRLTYSRQEGQTIRYKYVTVDAKSGQLKSLRSSRSYRGEDKEVYSLSVSWADAQATAETMMKVFAASHAGVMALADKSDAQANSGWEHLYYYQQTAGGYFFEGNHYTVGIDATDGTLSRLDGSFDEDVVLQVPGTVVTRDQAIDAYLAAMAVPYGYVEVPVSIAAAGNELMPLLKEAGYNYVMSLKTGYVLAQPDNAYVEGVYAQSGQAAVRTYDPQEPSALTYGDLEGHWVKTAADALALFGIGLGGGSLRPGDTLTQLDMVALLASVEGYSYDPATATREETDWLYNRAYSLGLVTPETRDETRAVTRGELVKVILDAAGYGRVAALSGIFRCDFSDAATLGAESVGYAALAQGLGLVNGGSDGAYAPARPITRAEAIAMLYQYMK